MHVQPGSGLDHFFGGNEHLRNEALLHHGISGIHSLQNGMLMCANLHSTFDSFQSWGVDSSGVIHALGTEKFQPPIEILRLKGKKIALHGRPHWFPYRNQFAAPSAFQLHLNMCRSVIAQSTPHK